MISPLYMFNSTRELVQLVSLILLITVIIVIVVQSVLLVLELGTLKSVLRDKTTRYLLLFLTGFWLMFFSRILGLVLDNIVIRVYLTGVFGLLAGIGFVLWSAAMIQLPDKLRYSFTTLTMVGFALFFIGRIQDHNTVSIAGLILIISLFMMLLLGSFRFIFRKSPYIRARQRVFIMTVSFIVMIILEGFAVSSMGTDNFLQASLFFFLEIPGRTGITLSILLPTSVSEYLRKFIK